jgi:hypothetical protein
MGFWLLAFRCPNVQLFIRVCRPTSKRPVIRSKKPAEAGSLANGMTLPAPLMGLTVSR